MPHPLREGFPTAPTDSFAREDDANVGDLRFACPVEADEIFIGGKGQHAENGHSRINRKQLAAGVRDRARVIPNRHAEQVVPFVRANTQPDAAVRGGRETLPRPGAVSALGVPQLPGAWARGGTRE